MIGYQKPTSKKKSRVNTWNRIRKSVLKPMFEGKGIIYCEVTKWEFERGNITEKEAKKRNFNLSFHHRHKRDWYKQFTRETEEKLLGSFDQVLLVGQYYHQLIEYDADLTEYYFRVLRGQESLPETPGTHG